MPENRVASFANQIDITARLSEILGAIGDANARASENKATAFQKLALRKDADGVEHLRTLELFMQKKIGDVEASKKLSVPLVTLLDLRATVVKSFKCELTINATSSTALEDKTSADIGVDAEAGFGFGPVSAKVKTSAKIATSSVNTHKDDYSAKMSFVLEGGLEDGNTLGWDTLFSKLNDAIEIDEGKPSESLVENNPETVG